MMEHVRVDGDNRVLDPDREHVQHLHVHPLLLLVFGELVEGNGNRHLDWANLEEA